MALRDRSAKHPSSPHLEPHVTAAPPARTPRQEARRRWTLRRAVEQLETRRLLTALTLHGGDQFIFINEDGCYEEVDLRGNITAELIGADVNGDTNQVMLTNLAGTLNGMEVNGGFNLPGAVVPIGPITILNPGGPAITAAPGAIAVAPNGTIYGIIVQTIPPANGMPAQNIVVLTQIDPNTGMGTVIADITGQVLAAAGIVPGTPGAVVTSIPAATYINGQIYFVGQTGGGAQPQQTGLFTIDPNNPAGSIAGVPGNFGGRVPTALGPGPNGGLVGATGSPGQLFPINTTNTNLSGGNIGTMGTINGPITGITSGPGGGSLITTGGNNPAVYTIGADGTVTLLGPLGTGNPGNIGTAGNGTVYGFDRTSRLLFTINTANRTRSQSIFQFYISQADVTGQISTSIIYNAAVPPGDTIGDPLALIPPAPGQTLPFDTGLRPNTHPGGQPAEPTGIAINVLDAQPPHPLISINTPGPLGDSLIGARSRRVLEVDPLKINNHPITTARIPFTNPFPSAPYVPGDMIHAGIVSAPGTTIGRIMIGGTVMGEVHLHGNIETFYDGWMLTGNTNGDPQNVNSDPGNFSADGDIRNVLVRGSVGTENDAGLNTPDYTTGFDMHVRGTLGQFHTFDSLIGNVNVEQSGAAQNLGGAIQEYEAYTPGPMAYFPWTHGDFSANQPNPFGDPMFDNSTFDTPQYLGALPSVYQGQPAIDVVDGNLNETGGDEADYYGVSLMAGQTITCKVVLTAGLVLPALGVFDPDGRLIASDYNNVNPGLTNEQYFRFTADRPGLYRFAVSWYGNTTFLNTNAVIGTTGYELTILGVGDLAVGAIAAANNILGNVDLTRQTSAEPTFGVLQGDLGAVKAGGQFMDNNISNFPQSAGGVSFVVQNGNLRAVDAGGIGLGGGGALIFTPFVQVPRGSVGLVQATGGSGTGNLYFNGGLTPPPIGGDYQVVSALNDLAAVLVADRGIGVIRAGTMTSGPSVFTVNADRVGNDGFIDLIDCAGQMGTLQLGGPQITVYEQGNVRYMRAGGTVYRDARFGGGQPETTVYQPGEVVTFTDDSGSRVTIAPTELASAAADVGPDDFLSGVTVDPNLPQLTITAYPIGGNNGEPNLAQHGGVAIMKVVSTGGVTITGSGNLPGQTAEIGEIYALGVGQGLTATPLPTPAPNSNGTTVPAGTTTATGNGNGSTTNLFDKYYGGTDTAGPRGRTLPLQAAPMLDPGGNVTPLDVILNGPARVDVLDVRGGSFTSIQNNTPGGEIANVHAATVGTITSNGTVGLLQGHTGAIPNGVIMESNTFPLVQQHNGIIIGTAGAGPNLVSYTTTSVSTGGNTGGTGGTGGNTTGSGSVGGGGASGGGTATTTMTVGGPAGYTTSAKGGTSMTTDANGNTTTITTTVAVGPLSAGNEFIGVATITAANGLGNVEVTGNIGLLQGAVFAPVVVHQNLTGGIITSTTNPSTVVTTSADGTTTTTTTIRTIAAPPFGEIHDVVLTRGGIAPSGNGAISLAGIYAEGQIGPVSNNAPADIRGSIISNTGITSITLNNGSIIHSTIGTLATFPMSTEIPVPQTIPAFVSPITNPILDVGNIIVNGNGGIIGTAFTADHYGTIASHGFGIFESNFNGIADATITSLRADGYGIRGVTSNGSSIGHIVATGSGANVSTQEFSPDVRFMETTDFDPYFGIAPSRLTDINVYTGATASVPQVPGANGRGTDTGVIEDCSFLGNRDLGTLRAYEIRATDPVDFPTVINFANSMGSVSTLSTIDGLALTTGRVKSFHFGGDTNDLQFTIAGPIKKMFLGGNVLGNSKIEAIGVNGNIGTLVVGGSMNGSITATRKITSATINGGLSGVVSAAQVNNLTLRGGITGGNLDVQGNVNSLTFPGDIGLPGETLTIHGTIKTLKVGGNVNTNINVQGNLNKLIVGQSIISGNTVSVSNTLGLLQVNGDIQQGAVVTASLIKKEKVKGQVLGSVH